MGAVLAESTVEAYRAAVTRAERYIGGPVAGWSSSDVRRWWDWLHTAGGRGGRGVAPSTRFQSLAAVRWYCREHGIPDPTLGAIHPRGELLRLSRAQLEQLLAEHASDAELGAALRRMAAG